MNPQTLNTLLQLIRFGADTIDRYSKGEMTDEEVGRVAEVFQEALNIAKIKN